ncbi:unnamed protein product [Brachionus calyciflorus]|uniref:CBM21 domain-containing protein n=1 Tax=Brachionus calyciflorus TaxID=104777 RepID=A0A814HHZ1_9BILA|nr:unnamed protein product [Brachionus calyciflorus]
MFVPYKSLDIDLEFQLERISLKLKSKSIYFKNQYCSTLTNESNLDKKTQKQDSKNKKKVRFADSLGYEQVHIKLITKNLADLDLKEKIERFNFKQLQSDYKKLTFEPLFVQPGLQPNFMSQLNERKVILETVEINNYELNGYIRVINISFHKRVFVRYTTNNWESYTDLDCSYVPSSSNGLTDLFHLLVLLDQETLIKNFSNNIEFAICYEVRNSENLKETLQNSYWDNNCEKNYQFRCTLS